jgi:opacity protein-like surface antigen
MEFVERAPTRPGHLQFLERSFGGIRGTGLVRENLDDRSNTHGSRSREDQDRMKKIAFLAALLAACVAVGRAQESRQDVSLSGFGLIEPFIASTTTVQVNSNPAYGALASYRFMLTPSTALEANYGITYQNSISYYSLSFSSSSPSYKVLTRTQEISGAFVKSFVLKNWNPFVEAGPAGIIYLPIVNSGTTNIDSKQQTAVGGLFGAGFAYEISPSFDIRAEYRGLLTKVPSLVTEPNVATNRWWLISEPTVGVAYHF